MKKYALVPALLVCVVLAGCVTTLNQIYTDKDLTFDKSILGDWQDADTPETYSLSQSGENEYHLLYTNEEGIPAEFTLHLVRIDSLLFFDVFPDEPDLGGNEFYEIHFLPVHSFVRVVQTDPEFLLATINSDWLDDYVQEHPGQIAGQDTEGELVLTAQTEDLQRFLIKMASTEGAFNEPGELIRLQ